MTRKLLITIATLVGFCMTSNAELKGDTLIIEQVEKVKIETRDTVQRIVISGAKDDPYFQYVQRISIPDTSAVHRKIKNVKNFNKIKIENNCKNTESKRSISLHMALGLNTMTSAPSDYSFKLFPSLEYNLGVTFDYSPFGRKNEWSIGIGVDWRYYRMSNDKFLAKNDAGVLELYPYGDEQPDRQTHLSAFSLQVPLLYTHYFNNNRKWGVTLGGIVNFNTGAHAERKFTYDGEDYTVETGSIHQRPVTVDLMAAVRTPSSLYLYVKYCPMTFFKNNQGAKMHQLSFGVGF